MIRFASVAIAALVISTPALAQPQPQPMPQISISVRMGGFDSQSNTYNGAVYINAGPCPDASYNLAVTFVHAKNIEDALAMTKADVDKIVADITRNAQNCRAR